jgi:hypothetical protein
MQDFTQIRKSCSYFKRKFQSFFVFFFNLVQQISQDSSVGVVTRLWARRLRHHSVSGVSKNFSLPKKIQTISWAHQASHLMVTVGTTPSSKAVGA